ncbi:hypothetical protein GCM10009775_06940 [Microbacterium aoyamense]|uniref:Flagellar hook-length control protein FliK n=1 Tax=Microbacterium aoyamense TaxID=344166 RepID=A0ABN2PB10_9MICO
MSVLPTTAPATQGAGPAPEWEGDTEGAVFGAVLASMDAATDQHPPLLDAELADSGAETVESSASDRAAESSAAPIWFVPAGLLPPPEALPAVSGDKGGSVASASSGIASLELLARALSIAADETPPAAGTTTGSVAAVPTTPAALPMPALAESVDGVMVGKPAGRSSEAALRSTGTPSAAATGPDAPTEASAPPAAAQTHALRILEQPALVPTAGAPESSARQTDGGASASAEGTVAPTVSLATATGAHSADETTTAPVAPRTIASQVAPAVISIVQRPAGTHQLTLTVAPESLGPVTVRAHIGQGGEVKVELIGATELGRDALRTIVAELRRDLAATMPQATLSLGAGAGADAGAADRGPHTGSGEGFSQQRGGDDAPAGRSGAPSTGDDADQRPTRATSHPATAGIGVGLDVLV